MDDPHALVLLRRYLLAQLERRLLTLAVVQAALLDVALDLLERVEIGGGDRVTIILKDAHEQGGLCGALAHRLLTGDLDELRAAVALPLSSETGPAEGHGSP